ncbi:hypothetical protein H2200_001238 [Cladophialophora chaetospira]|uniref:Aminoglycoside phosphotransferase domain-containing protein n=1 Tax=Cladophialophora chaetospira TaxID=386627 RepID=A0AA38XKH5_9EURO|nr:hypothetical protein H2200_001238 [Cladophialophora chaetospira]
MSSKSTTPNSTSTYEYSQEPYESFSLKVTELAQTLVNSSQVEVRRIKGGGYNRTVIAQLAFQGTTTTGIFRIPRFSYIFAREGITQASSVERGILDQAAVLEFLSSRKVNTPQLLAFDSIAANCIESPHTLHRFSTGIPLLSRYETTTVSEKKTVADSLVSFLLQMETIQFDYAGRLGVAPEFVDIVKQSLLSTTEQTHLSIQNQGFSFGSRVFREDRSLYNLLSSLFIVRLEKEILRCGDSIGADMWFDLLSISREMKECGFFQDKQPWDLRNVLHHWDLAPRNILIRPKQSSLSDDQSPEWEIDTVMDWDDVYCVNPVLTRSPPVWLWDFGDDDNPSLPEGFDGDVDLLPLDRYKPKTGDIPQERNQAIRKTEPPPPQHRISEEDYDIKQYFEERLVKGLVTIYPTMRREDYFDQAYGKGRWVRRLARFAFHGASFSEDIKRFWQLAEEWKVEYENQTSTISSIERDYSSLLLEE